MGTDVGQPELVYKLMNVAGHQVLWIHQRGAALAGSMLRKEEAAELLRPHVQRLLPRLYV